MTLIFKNDLRRNVSQASQIFIHLIACGVIPYLGMYRYGDEGFDFGFKFAAVYFLTIFIIHMVVHFRYHAIEKGRKLCFNDNTAIYTLNDNGVEVSFSIHDIERVYYRVSRAFLGHGLHYFPWDSYCYAYLYLKSGQQLIVTSLLLPDLAWPSDFKSPEISESLFRWPPVNK